MSVANVSVDLDFSKIGTLIIGGQRFKCRFTEIEHTFGQPSVFRGELIPIFGGTTEVARDPEIKNVIFNDPATVVMWSDGTKTVVKCQPGDTYSKETGLALCIAKKYLGNKGNFNEVFKKWIPEEKDPISVDDMRRALYDFCEGKSCGVCPLNSPVCRCGCGTHFLEKNAGRYCMTDDEIRAAYKVAFK